VIIRVSEAKDSPKDKRKLTKQINGKFCASADENK
jgi:hypothetical protein